ncbi:MAG: hypothetical protein ABI134_03060 [Byssovorax sp.]
MALKDLTTPTFISVLDAWLDPKRELGLVQGLGRASTLEPDLTSARNGLQATHAASAKAPPELAKLQEKAGLLDKRHDRKARGLDKVLDGLSELTDDEELASQLQTARGELLGPLGLSVILTSYTDEATSAKLADARLSDASKQVFKDVTIGDKPVAKWVKDWQAVAKQLGEADAEKTAVETKLAAGATPAEALKARNTGIRVINAFLGMLALDAPDAATRARILGPLEAALAKVARRAKPAATDGSKSGEPEGSPSGTGTPPVTP